MLSTSNAAVSANSCVSVITFNGATPKGMLWSENILAEESVTKSLYKFHKMFFFLSNFVNAAGVNYGTYYVRTVQKQEESI